MIDTIETLKAAAAEITARVAAFEKAQKAEVEPPKLTEEQYTILLHEYHSSVPGRVNQAQLDAGKRLRYLESAHAADQAELARLREENAALREAQKAHGQDITSFELRSWADDNDFEYNPNTQKEYIRRQCRAMAREIARRRGLTLDGAK